MLPASTFWIIQLSNSRAKMYEIIDIEIKINYTLVGRNFYSKFDMPIKGEIRNE